MGLGIAVDGSGAAYVGGIALAADYPTTAGAYDTTYNGPRDGFITKLTPPALAISNAGVVEGDAGEQSAVLEVTMDSDTGTVKVDYATEDGSAQAPGDYLATAGTLTFQARPDSEERIEVPIADDALDEPVETLRVRLSNARYAPIADAVGVVTITDDDDPPALTVNDKSITEGNAGTDEHGLRSPSKRPRGRPSRRASRPTTAPRRRPRTSREKSGTVDIRPGRHLASGRRRRSSATSPPRRPRPSGC